ncbi:UvrD-helicase domain-containing protein [Oceanivirga salmonicida]|uniref:UvrD-helicase domain-containing protein n=1 Tax=Oceanivirga salmonicida TaxID=1769291 RepID=UPI0012E2878D|nr:UvrD-helicase domain-containing protein [Oceanivirga salmonicida]
MKSKIISASAGTGKTYTMALEYIKALNKGIKYDEIMVITFTKKATAEIKERVFLFLKLLAYKENGYENIEKSLGIKINREELKQIYKEMVSNSENIKITTNDALINRVFKSTIAGYNNLYSYEIVSDNSEEYITSILDELITKHFDVFSSLYELNDQKTVESQQELIKNILKNKPMIYDIVDKPFVFDKKQDINHIKDDLVKFFYEYKDMIFVRKYTSNKVSKTENIVINDKIEEIKKIENVNELLNFFGEFSGDFLKRTIQGDNKELAKTLNTKIKESDFKQRICELYTEQVIYKYNEVYRKVAKLCYEIDNRMKFSIKKLTYDDITFFTNMYLKDNSLNLIKNGEVTEDFLEMIGGKLKVLMIDEFQDTSPMQFNLFLPIIKTCEYILIVGDEKQAIYGFRGADSNLFKNIDKILRNNIENIEIEKSTLSTCYRTSSNVINYINETFNDLDNFDYENVAYVKEGGFVDIVESKNDTLYLDIVNRINKNSSNSSAILFRSNKDLTKILTDLEENNIKYNSIKSMALIKDKNISDIKLLIDYLVTKNTYKLLEFLRSDSIAFMLKDIKKYIDGDLEKENEIITHVNELMKDSSDFKRKYLKYFGYNTEMNSEDILNINKFLDLVDKSKNLEDFYDTYDIVMTGINQENAESSGINLMTIHKSKGLEYDDIHYVYTFKKETFAKYVLVKEYDENFNVVNFVFIKKRKIVEETDFGKKYFAMYDNEEIEAAMNLTYVGLTRPKKNLYVYFIPSKNDYMKFIPKTIGMKIESSNEKMDEKISEFKNGDFFTKTKYEKKIKNIKVNNIESEMVRKTGLAVHYYLEYLKTLEDKEYSYSMLMKKYGNLLGPNICKNVEKRCIDFANTNKDIFDNKFEIYTEYEIFDEDKKYIIDRLNIDRENKIAYIYDYKTLKDPDKVLEYRNQIENYKNILKKEMQDYEIRTKLLSI